MVDEWKRFADWIEGCSWPAVREHRSRAISFNQGAKWNTLISMYIGTIPLSGRAPYVAEQSMSDAPPPRTTVSSAMTVKAGVAARSSQSAAPRAVALLLP